MWTYRAAARAAVLGVLCAPPALSAAEYESAPAQESPYVPGSLGIRIEAGFTADDNVTRSRGEDKLSDHSYSLNLSKSLTFPLSPNARLVVLASLGGEKFENYNGLSHYFAGIQGELQHRLSGEFGAPTFGLFARSFRDAYESNLRDGYRHSVGINVRKPVTDRIDLFGALAYNKRDGKSRVFDNRDYSARLNLDYSATRGGTLYLGAEYRRGDVVSTARPALAFIDIADAIVRDDAFTDTERQAYRFEGRTVLTTVGYNLALGERHALDFSWRWVRSTSKDRPSFPGAETIRYTDNQFTVAYLIRF